MSETIYGKDPEDPYGVKRDKESLAEQKNLSASVKKLAEEVASIKETAEGAADTAAKASKKANSFSCKMFWLAFFTFIATVVAAAAAVIALTK